MSANDKRPIIALMTDFSLRDTYVGVMKGVIKTICPEADLIDLTHDIPPQAVAQAAFLLATSHAHFPEGTVFLAVVDPGVGSSRAALAVRAAGKVFVAPDNGLLSLVWRQAENPAAHSITDPDFRLPGVSSTFHGRDIFAPAAAHIAAGLAIEKLGPLLPDIEHLSFALPLRESPTRIRATIVHTDHFGNIITNVRHQDLPRGYAPKGLKVDLSRRAITGLSNTYSSVNLGQPLIHWGSSDFLEIAVAGGSASSAFKLSVGDTITVECETA